MIIYKILARDAWQAAQSAGVFNGASIDLADGFIHFSAADQVYETAAKHFAEQQDLMLLAINPAALPANTLKWEASRGGALFPHLYAPLPLSAVTAAVPLPWDGTAHVFPDPLPA